MKQKFILSIIFMVVAGMLHASQPVNEFEQGNSYHGFTLKEKRFVPEVNAECLYFVHDQSGAQLMKIAADDPNKLFNIAFKTIPSNSTGVAHIMEHSVLNGSRNFPVKSPFTVLTQGSLNTFLNAMTGSDFTTYPVASLNDKDYFNLMHVYLDAVLFPRIYDDERIFMQEAWHYELDSLEGEMVYKGVVFNEMKGAYSSPTRELFYQVNKILFPDNTYGVCSGGYPSVIPELTYEEYKNFHKTYYHPTNSYITLYGNADLNKELAFINEKYLSEFNRSRPVNDIVIQKPFTQMKKAQKPYAVAEGSSTENNTYLTLNFVVGENYDGKLNMAMDVLAQALVNHQSSPVRMALQEAGIGKNVSAGMRAGKQNLFLIVVENAEMEQQDQFKEIVFNTMKEVAENGFDKEVLEGIINRNEFYLREGADSNKGMSYMMGAYRDWFFNNDPFAGLQFEDKLAYIKQAMDSPLLENLLEKHIINNSHSLLLALYPEPGLERENSRKEREILASKKASMTNEELQKIVEQTRELKAYQERQDSPEALASIPMLSLDDISPEIQYFELDHKKVKKVPVHHYNTFTNNIFYNYMYFDMRTLPQDLIPYARLLSSIMRQLGTRDMNFGDLENALNIHTGSFYTYLDTYQPNQSEDEFLPFFVAHGKATAEKSEKFFELASDIINNFKLDDKERLQTVITRHQASVENQMKNDGVNVAIRRLGSYYSKKGLYDEMTSGLAYYQFITNISKNFDEKHEDLVKNLQQVASLLFNRDNMQVQVTCDASDYRAYSATLGKFISRLPAERVKVQQWQLEPVAANEALLTPSKVQFVVQGFDYKKMGYDYNGKMMVLNQILSRVYLQNTIRVMGGAYGGWSSIGRSGNMYFTSYRDPNLKETLDNYKGAIDFLQNFEASDVEMTRYIIGTISRLDRPYTPSVQGQWAWTYFMENIKPEDLKAEREAVLTTTAGDIRAMADLINDMIDKDVYCVYGSEEKVRANESLFNSVVNLTE